MNQVEVRLWTNEKMSPNVIPNASADVSHEVIAAYEIGTTEEVTIKKRLIKAQTLPADPGHHFGLHAFSELWRVDSVKVVEQGTVGQSSTIEVPTGPPSQFAAKTEVVLN
jgi:hypothetical protein